MGREVTLSEPATRVVALSAADCEVLYAVGAGDLLVGRGEFCDYPAQVLDVPAVQSGMETNLEQIIALKPQVLLMSAMAQTEDQVKQLEAAGIACVVSDAKDIAGVYTAITLIGALTGHDADAAGVVASMQSTFDALAARAGELQGKSVYFEVSPLQYGPLDGRQGHVYGRNRNHAGAEKCFCERHRLGGNIRRTGIAGESRHHRYYRHVLWRRVETGGGDSLTQGLARPERREKRGHPEPCRTTNFRAPDRGWRTARRRSLTSF